MMPDQLPNQLLKTKHIMVFDKLRPRYDLFIWSHKIIAKMINGQELIIVTMLFALKILFHLHF